MMSAAEILGQLRARVAASVGAASVDGVAVDKPLHALGLDSMGFVDLLVFIEKQFGLPLMSSGFSQDDFSSLEAVANRIAATL
jgi:acyl carrier protein